MIMLSTEKQGINLLLERRGAWLKGDPQDVELARRRQQLTRGISSNYPIFEKVRDDVLRAADAALRNLGDFDQIFSAVEREMLVLMQDCGVVQQTSKGLYVPSDSENRRYISGGWLEELAWLAALEAGADEALFGQNLGWSVKGYSGENEIDVIAKWHGQLCFISCKALRSELDMQDRKHRHRLMDAVHEADNLIDHFGRLGDQVAVLVTTDLFDEIKGAPRYSALMGKAAVLDVNIIALEDLNWTHLVRILQSFKTRAELGEKAS
jgi:hypothetical protein